MSPARRPALTLLLSGRQDWIAAIAVMFGIATWTGRTPPAGAGAARFQLTVLVALLCAQTRTAVSLAWSIGAPVTLPQVVE